MVDECVAFIVNPPTINFVYLFGHYIKIKGNEFLFICVIWIQASIGKPYPDVVRKTILCPKYLSLSIPVVSLPVAGLFLACEREMIA